MTVEPEPLCLISTFPHAKDHLHHGKNIEIRPGDSHYTTLQRNLFVQESTKLRWFSSPLFSFLLLVLKTFRFLHLSVANVSNPPKKKQVFLVALVSMQLFPNSFSPTYTFENGLMASNMRATCTSAQGLETQRRLTFEKKY